MAEGEQGVRPPEQHGARDRRDRLEQGSLRDRRDRLEQRIQERFDEPIARVTNLTQQTLALFPTRVWRRFLAGNGFILSSGMSYQALFAVFAAVYIVFAVAGIWLTGSRETMDALVRLINTYVPSLIGEHGIIKDDDLRRVAESSGSVLTITGIAALIVLVWTAIGWITYSRIAVRTIFGMPRDRRAYLYLKARDLVVSLLLGVVLFAAAVLSVISTSAIDWLLGLVGVTSHDWTRALVTVISLLVVFAIDVGALMVMFRFLAGARLTVRRMAVGSLLGGAGHALLQVLGSRLLDGATQNPLLSTFVVFIALLLWFRITSVVTLVAASWIAVAAEDRHERLYEPTVAERAALERDALFLAAEVRLRAAEEEYRTATFFRRPAAKWRRDAAREELATLAGGDAAFSRSAFSSSAFSRSSDASDRSDGG